MGKANRADDCPGAGNRILGLEGIHTERYWTQILLQQGDQKVYMEATRRIQRYVILSKIFATLNKYFIDRFLNLDIVESMQFEEKRSKEKASGPVYVNFETKEEAEEAWLEMLRTVGVEPNWTWEQCIRKASGNPIYRALKTTSERKEAFERYCRETKEERLVIFEK